MENISIVDLIKTDLKDYLDLNNEFVLEYLNQLKVIEKAEINKAKAEGILEGFRGANEVIENHFKTNKNYELSTNN